MPSSIKCIIIVMALFFLAGGGAAQQPQPTPTPVVTPRPTPAATPARTPETQADDQNRVNRRPPPLPRNQPGGARPGAVNQQQTVQRATQEKPKAKKSLRVGGKEVPPELTYPIEAVRGSLHFQPLDLQAPPGSSFTLELVLTNRSKMPAEGFDITLGFDTQWIEFLDYSAEPIGFYLGDAEERLRFEEEKGRLHFSSLFRYLLGDEQAVLLKLHFQAADYAGKSRIRFLFPPEGETAVYAGGENILGAEAQGLRGVLPAHVFITTATDNEFLPFADAAAPTTDSWTPPVNLQVAKADHTSTDTLQQFWFRIPPDARPEARTWLSLQGPLKNNLQRGDTFWVDLVLHNQELAPIDSIGARIEFDPAVLEVLDTDQDNWIQRGVNIWDGGFHEAYPFDFHRANKVNNSRGVIRYHAGRQNGVWTFPTGVFARIRFRAKEPAAASAIRLVRKKGDRKPETFIRSYGIDRIGKRAGEDGLLWAVSVRVQPGEAGAQASLAEQREELREKILEKTGPVSDR